MRLKHLDISNHKIWKDKNIKPEAKEIYAYLFAEGFEKNYLTYKYWKNTKGT